MTTDDPDRRGAWVKDMTDLQLSIALSVPGSWSAADLRLIQDEYKRRGDRRHGGPGG